jgi:thiamine-phosphate pyrophosphorylase
MGSEIGFYGIISEPVVGWERLARIMVEEGVEWIQLRMKRGSAEERRAVAEALRRVIPAGHRFIVNDDPHLAAAVGADGVHLGQDDGGIAWARGLLGSEAIVGLSTHSPAQVARACALQPSYIGMGPVFPTSTKADAEPRIGLDGLRAMARLTTVPGVAIGGIGLAEVPAVCAAGAGGLCAVGPVNSSEDPAAVIRAFRAAITDAR